MVSIVPVKASDLAQLTSAANGNLIIMHDGTGLKAITFGNFQTNVNAPMQTLIDALAKTESTDIANVKSLIEALTKTESTDITNVKNLIAPLLYNNAGAHNAIYRGKNLGTSLTDAQSKVIKAGTFDDLYIGDYWVINGVTWRIAGFDYWYRCGDTECTTHHVVIVPDSNLYNAKMNDTNITTGAYVGSLMYTTNLATAKTTISNAFGDHVLSHRVYLNNAVTNGYPSGGAWVSSTVDLMCEEMVYGSGIFHPVSTGSTVPANYRVEKSQLPLFALEPSRITNRGAYWLRDVVSATYFAYVAGDGGAAYSDASYSRGVRPAFAIS